ncbi:hypothetical protein [Phenylobacterium sp.]|uniref:hypothetical protein n=1 Tax=Phenylobacterium sp. TaxID=1871053 RepID=UPI0019B326EC|nr:hypothetical protein [Phenylobacterium sp.]MBC7168764.1 hypothetical protein [Phenylobacterium sp.]
MAGERSRDIEIGMVIAAAICVRYFGEGVVAEEILGAAGISDMADLRRIGADAYDVQALRGVLRHMKARRAALQPGGDHGR